MKNAALVLGIIGGAVGMIVGFFVYGWVVFTQWFNDQAPGAIDQVANADRLQMVGLIAPILAIAGGAMSRNRPLIGAGLMAASAWGMYWGLGFGVFTMFPIAMCIVAAILGLIGGLSGEVSE